MGKLKGLALSGVVLVMSVSVGALAQTEARPATAEEIAAQNRAAGTENLTEVPSPMVLEVVLPGHATPRGILDLKPGSQETWFSSSMAKFVCDQARVRQVRVRRDWGSKKKAELEISATLTSGWYRQDVDLSMELLASNGAVLGKRKWQDLTLGNNAGPYSGDRKTQTLRLEIPMEVFEREFGSDSPPTLKIMVAIDDD